MSKRMFHNLDGVLRDMLAAADLGEGEGYERLLTFARIIADIIDILEDVDDDTDLPDPSESPGGEPESDVGLRDSEGRPRLGEPHEGHAPVRDSHMVEPPGLGTSMVSRVRSLSAAGMRGTRQPLVRAGARHRAVEP